MTVPSIFLADDSALVELPGVSEYGMKEMMLSG